MTNEELQHQDAVKFRQFLSDIITACGLLSHGKQSKILADRIAEQAFIYMSEIKYD